MTQNVEALKRIKKQEQKDRYIATILLNNLFSNCTDSYSIIAHAWDAPVDLTLDFTKGNRQFKYDFEVKERNKDIEKYNNAELREKKLKNLLNNSNNNLYYIVLLNQQTAYIYNLKKIDFSKVEKIDWNLKYCQLNEIENADNYITTETTYLIPTELAEKKVDITDIYNMYNKQFNSNANN